MNSFIDQFLTRKSPHAAFDLAMQLEQGGRVARAFPLYLRAADAGIAMAQYRVGRAYLRGLGAQVNRRLAAMWLERAAHSGVVEAQTQLATLYLHGFIGKQRAGADKPKFVPHAMSQMATEQPDYIEAERWARMAANRGSAEAMTILGYIFTAGPEAMRDPDQGDRWYEQAAQADMPQGHLGLGLAILRKAKVDADYVKAVKSLRKAAEAGLPKAMHLLGWLAERRREAEIAEIAEH